MDFWNIKAKFWGKTYVKYISIYQYIYKYISAGRQFHQLIIAFYFIKTFQILLKLLCYY